MSAGVEVALVADDLTGALDAAAPFAAHGLRVRVYPTLDTLPFTAGASLPKTSEAPPGRRDEPAPPDAPGMVLAVSTSSRHSTPDAARRAVAEAGRRLRGWSPRLVFKKIDSTMRGPVPEEVAAAMEAFARRAALVCPAFPAAGRVVRGGEVLVYGTPLRETEYVRDLRTPAPAESIETLFGRIGPVRRRRPDEAPWTCPPAGVAVADAGTEAELAALAALADGHAHEVLAVGSDGLAAGLASLRGGASGPVRLVGGAAGIVLFAIGSRAGTTARQVERLLEARPETPVVDAPAGVLDAEAVLRGARSSRIVAARVPPFPRGEPGAVARAFAAGVRDAAGGLGRRGPAVLAATGGDTVEAILDAFGIAALDVLGEFRPGVPVSRAATGAGMDRPGFTLVSKAGGFGSPDLFTEIAAEAVGR